MTAAALECTWHSAPAEKLLCAPACGTNDPRHRPSSHDQSTSHQPTKRVHPAAWRRVHPAAWHRGRRRRGQCSGRLVWRCTAAQLRLVEAAQAVELRVLGLGRRLGRRRHSDRQRVTRLLPRACVCAHAYVCGYACKYVRVHMLVCICGMSACLHACVSVCVCACEHSMPWVCACEHGMAWRTSCSGCSGSGSSMSDIVSLITDDGGVLSGDNSSIPHRTGGTTIGRVNVSALSGSTTHGDGPAVSGGASWQKTCKSHRDNGWVCWKATDEVPCRLQQAGCNRLAATGWLQEDCGFSRAGDRSGQKGHGTHCGQ